MSPIEEIQQEIIEEFEFFDDWMQKYEHLIELGKTLPKMEETKKTDDNLINGCQSKVWIYADKEEGNIIYTVDSDAILTKGVVALLLRVFSNQTPQAILDAKTDFIDQIGLKEHLSPTRANGLLAMVKQIKLYALALS
jgi:cysteine desulfuration protein SufE